MREKKSDTFNNVGSYNQVESETFKKSTLPNSKSISSGQLKWVRINLSYNRILEVIVKY